MDKLKEFLRIAGNATESLSMASESLDLILDEEAIYNFFKNNSEDQNENFLLKLEIIKVFAESISDRIADAKEHYESFQKQSEDLEEQDTYCSSCSGTGVSSMSAYRPDDYGPHTVCKSCSGRGSSN